MSKAFTKETENEDELHDEPGKIRRLAARAEWKGDPPDNVRDWLAERGVEV